MLDFQATRWLTGGEVPPQAGNNHPTSIPTGVFKTSDGYINIAAAGQKMWERVCETLGIPDVAKHPDYATGAARSKNRDALNAAMEKETVKNTSAHWVDGLQQGRRAVRADLFDRPDLRRRAGQAPRHRQGRPHAEPEDHPPGRASRSRCRARRAASWRRRRCSASTPTRFWPSSASARTRSTKLRAEKTSCNAPTKSADSHERDDQAREGAAPQGRRASATWCSTIPSVTTRCRSTCGPRWAASWRISPRTTSLRCVVLIGRRQQGVRVRRRHLALRRGALQRGGGRALQRDHREGEPTRCYDLPEADDRDDPRLLHRRRPRHRDLLRPAHRARTIRASRCRPPSSASATAMRA